MFKKLFYLGLMVPVVAVASDQVLVLFGGDNPGLNNYSQYLQTKTTYNYLKQKYGIVNIAVFFGIWNSENIRNPFPDVHQIKIINNVASDYMLPGIIENNSAATKNNIYQYFFRENIIKINPNDNLRLFISANGLANPYLEDKPTKSNHWF